MARGRRNNPRARSPDGKQLYPLTSKNGGRHDTAGLKLDSPSGPSLRRLSLTGRNTLLQSIFYGSFRYWLYFLEMPESVIKLTNNQVLALFYVPPCRAHLSLCCARREPRHSLSPCNPVCTSRARSGIWRVDRDHSRQPHPGPARWPRPRPRPSLEPELPIRRAGSVRL